MVFQIEANESLNSWRLGGCVTLPETNSSHLKKGRAAKGKDLFRSINFQDVCGRACLFFFKGDKLMVNGWFGARWFGCYLRVSDSIAKAPNPFHHLPLVD